MGIFSKKSSSSVANDNRSVTDVEIEGDGRFAGQFAGVKGNINFTQTSAEAFKFADNALKSVVTLSAEREQGTTDQLLSLERGIVSLKDTGSNSIKWIAGAVGLIGIAMVVSR